MITSTIPLAVLNLVKIGSQRSSLQNAKSNDFVTFCTFSPFLSLLLFLLLMAKMTEPILTQFYASSYLFKQRQLQMMGYVELTSWVK